jgi:hypothetical protein
MFLDMLTFQQRIEEIVESTGATHMEAVIEFCNENDIEPEEIAKLVSPSLMSMIESNAQDAGLMKRKAKLPV